MVVSEFTKFILVQLAENADRFYLGVMVLAIIWVLIELYEINIKEGESEIEFKDRELKKIKVFVLIITTVVAMMLFTPNPKRLEKILITKELRLQGRK